MAEVEAEVEAEAEVKRLGALLSGVSRRLHHHDAGITEELLRGELFPELPPEQFAALRDKMEALLRSIAVADMDPAQLEAFLTAQGRKQGVAAVSAHQAAALSRFWRSQRGRVRESLLARSRWEPGLRGLSWRVDLQAAAGRGDAGPAGPLALVELELGRAEQDSEFICLEFDEAAMNQVLNKMADIQRTIAQRS